MFCKHQLSGSYNGYIIQKIDKQCPTLCEEGSGLSNSRCVIDVSCNDPFADVYPFINVVV